MKKTILTILLCGVMLLGITGCGKELQKEQKDDMMDGDFKIIDKTKDIENFACDTALEKFYEDEKYTYSWECIMNKYIVVKYENGEEKLVSEALKDDDITIQDLDRFNIKYIKENISNTKTENPFDNYKSDEELEKIVLKSANIPFSEVISFSINRNYYENGENYYVISFKYKENDYSYIISPIDGKILSPTK